MTESALYANGKGSTGTVLEKARVAAAVCLKPCSVFLVKIGESSSPDHQSSPAITDSLNYQSQNPGLGRKYSLMVPLFPLPSEI